MNTEKIEKLKKALKDDRTPENLKKRMLSTIAMFEAEDLKESASKVAHVAPEEKEEPTPAPKVEKAKVTRTPRVKKVVAHKESTAKKPTAMALAKDIRKDGESWKEAVKRASSEMKKGTTETKKAVVETKKATITEMQKLLKFVKRRKELKGIFGTNLQRDASRSAKPSGKRTSKDGNVYYENRENRTDRLAPNYPKGSPKLANGGFMDGVYAEEGAEVTYIRNKDGIRVKSVAMPEERLTEAEWLAKHNESREARTYQLGGGIFADTFSGYTGTHYTGLVGETNAMSSGEMFMAGGRVRRTKSQMTKDRENKEIDAYNWYIVDLQTNKAITGNEYKEDAIDALSDYDGDKRYKVVSKRTLKSLGIENPNESWKSYEVGGGVGELFPYAVGKDFTKENSFEISPNDVEKYKSMGFDIEFLQRKDIDLLKKIQLANEKKIIQRKIDDEVRRNDKRTDIQKTKDEIKELGLSFSNEIKEYNSLNWHYNIIDNDTGEVYGYEVDSKTMITYPINEESKDYINILNNHYQEGGAIANQQLIADAHLRPAEMFGREGIPAYASGGGVRTQNGREYSLGRNWTNDHRHENKDEDYEVPMYRRK
jgi:hypothetical protein